jgi:hypothetical protein
MAGPSASPARLTCTTRRGLAFVRLRPTHTTRGLAPGTAATSRSAGAWLLVRRPGDHVLRAHARETKIHYLVLARFACLGLGAARAHSVVPLVRRVPSVPTATAVARNAQLVRGVNGQLAPVCRAQLAPGVPLVPMCARPVLREPSSALLVAFASPAGQEWSATRGRRAVVRASSEPTAVMAPASASTVHQEGSAWDQLASATYVPWVRAAEPGPPRAPSAHWGVGATRARPRATIALQAPGSRSQLRMASPWRMSARSVHLASGARQPPIVARRANRGHGAQLVRSGASRVHPDRSSSHPR